MAQLNGKQIKDNSIEQSKLNILLPNSGDTGSIATVGYVNDNFVNKSGDTMIGGLKLPNITVQKSFITYQENLNVVSGSTNIICTLPNTYSAVFFDYLLTDGTSSRVGTVMVVNTIEIRFTEVSTTDINDTSFVNLSVDLYNDEIRLLSDVTDSNIWLMKVHIRTF